MDEDVFALVQNLQKVSHCSHQFPSVTQPFQVPQPPGTAQTSLHLRNWSPVTDGPVPDGEPMVTKDLLWIRKPI